MTPDWVTARAPASVSNLGPGFDILGCAIEGAYDAVTATRSTRAAVVVQESGHPELPTDASLHSSAIAASEVLRLAGHSATGVGVELRVEKGIPLSGGQGGSAASAVAAAVAVNALLDNPLSQTELIEACLVAEEHVAGRHADNVAAALLGGIILVRALDPLDVISLNAPADLRIVVVHPNQRVNTREARAVVPAHFPRETLVFQAAQLAAFVTALARSDYALMARSLEDRVAEPYRASLLPGFAEARAAALRSGALGASISGSGPTSFALVQGDIIAARVALEMARAYNAAGMQCKARVSRVGAGTTTQVGAPISSKPR